jgi:creatinine amidohydrolase
MQLAELTTTDAADALDRAEVALLPTGSTEQHGPALPLATDAVAAESVAAGLDRDDVVQLPTVSVGVSEHHRQFHGTLWLSEETFEAAVRETLASLASHGVRKAVIVNGHGGNTAANTRAARRLRTAETAFAVPWNWWEGVPEELPEELFDEGGGHADAGESSTMLHLRQDLVDVDALEAAEAGAPESWGHDVAGASVGFDTLDFSASGATGKPTQASVDAGRQLVDAAVGSLDELVGWLVDQPLDELWSKPHK